MTIILSAVVVGLIVACFGLHLQVGALKEMRDLDRKAHTAELLEIRNDSATLVRELRRSLDAQHTGLLREMDERFSVDRAGRAEMSRQLRDAARLHRDDIARRLRGLSEQIVSAQSDWTTRFDALLVEFTPVQARSTEALAITESFAETLAQIRTDQQAIYDENEGIIRWLEDVPQNFAFHKAGIEYKMILPDRLKMKVRSRT